MFEPPPIDDADVLWACRALGLNATAFGTSDGADPRFGVLQSNDTLDIEACPGSGKTTLLVAKLGMLTRKWRSTRSGICILSHTNAARREIERCLGQTAVGVRLLSFPHFVGTIHGFVSTFLAFPWLRSLGYPIKCVDDALCEQHRRRLLHLNRYTTLRAHVVTKERNQNANYVGSWQVVSPDFLVQKRGDGHLFTNPHATSARQLRSLAEQCVQDGFYTYDELFMWAADLLEKCPDAVAIIRQRFPMLFIDEVQDNSELQSSLLQRVFMQGDRPVTRQRFGDSNQAIYGHTQAVGAQSDPFPTANCRRDIPNSYRFGQEIAEFANPLGLRPQGLRGLGPPSQIIHCDTRHKHAVFLFDDDSMTSVLDAYGSYLLQVFSEKEIQAGSFTAVGAVHRPGEDTNQPRSVGNYWPEYDHELTSSEPKPSTFHQYIDVGWNRSGNGGDVHSVVEHIADAVLRAAQIAEPTLRVGRHSRRHRDILKSITQDQELTKDYLAMVVRLVSSDPEVSSDEWLEKWVPVILRLTEKLGGASVGSAVLGDFLKWPTEPFERDRTREGRRRSNHYKFPAENPSIQIRVGSIHSVKGETHSAILVFDTYFHDHHFRVLKPWLLGESTGQGDEGVRNRGRLKQHYVAFTRPTHLLCLAMRDSLSSAEVQKLKNRAWRVASVRKGGTMSWR